MGPLRLYSICQNGDSTSLAPPLRYQARDIQRSPDKWQLCRHRIESGTVLRRVARVGRN